MSIEFPSLHSSLQDWKNFSRQLKSLPNDEKLIEKCIKHVENALNGNVSENDAVFVEVLLDCLQKSKKQVWSIMNCIEKLPKSKNLAVLLKNCCEVLETVTVDHSKLTLFLQNAHEWLPTVQDKTVLNGSWKLVIQALRKGHVEQFPIERYLQILVKDLDQNLSSLTTLSRESPFWRTGTAMILFSCTQMFQMSTLVNEKFKVKLFMEWPRLVSTMYQIQLPSMAPPEILNFWSKSLGMMTNLLQVTVNHPVDTSQPVGHLLVLLNNVSTGEDLAKIVQLIETLPPTQLFALYGHIVEQLIKQACNSNNWSIWERAFMFSLQSSRPTTWNIFLQVMEHLAHHYLPQTITQRLLKSLITLYSRESVNANVKICIVRLASVLQENGWQGFDVIQLLSLKDASLQPPSNWTDDALQSLFHLATIPNIIDKEQHRGIYSLALETFKLLEPLTVDTLSVSGRIVRVLIGLMSSADVRLQSSLNMVSQAPTFLMKCAKELESFKSHSLTTLSPNVADKVKRLANMTSSLSCLIDLITLLLSKITTIEFLQKSVDSLQNLLQLSDDLFPNAAISDLLVEIGRHPYVQTSNPILSNIAPILSKLALKSISGSKEWILTYKVLSCLAEMAIICPNEEFSRQILSDSKLLDTIGKMAYRQSLGEAKKDWPLCYNWKSQKPFVIPTSKPTTLQTCLDKISLLKQDVTSLDAHVRRNLVIELNQLIKLCNE